MDEENEPKESADVETAEELAIKILIWVDKTA